MELRHLRVFVAVAEELHFGKAAERLHLSNPPVSLAIKELESALGVRLFDRTSRKICLTAAGDLMLKEARDILGKTEALRMHAQDAASGYAGSLALGFISTAPMSFLPDVLRDFVAAHAEIHVSLQEMTSDAAIAALETGSIDAGCIFSSPQLPAGIRYSPVVRHELVVALPCAHPLAGRARVPLELLAAERFILFERHLGPAMFDLTLATCMARGFQPRLFHARQQHTIVSLVSGGMGVALFPECVQVMPRQGVVYRPLLGECPKVETGVAWRADDCSLVLQAFLASICAVAKKL